MTAQSNAKHADVQQSHLLVQHAQLPQQLQEHGSVQQAQHAPKASGLSALFNMGKKRKSRPAAVSQGAGASGKPILAATVGSSPPDTLPHSSSKQRAMQKLKVLAKKMRPSCMQACSSGTKSDELQEEDVQLQGLSSRKASTAEDVSRHAQPFAASVHVDSGGGKKQVLPGPSGQTPGLSRLRGIFRRKKTVARSNKQASSHWARGSAANSEPAASSTAGSFIAAVRAPCDIELQTEVSGSSTALGGKPADQVSSEACVVSAFTPSNGCKLADGTKLLSCIAQSSALHVSWNPSACTQAQFVHVALFQPHVGCRARGV